MLHSELERLALRYVPGEGAVAIDRLGSGLVNDSYRVARAGCLYALRVPGPQTLDLGLDRGWECRVLERATAGGLAPRIVCCEPAEGMLVAHWVDGQPWTLDAVRRPENIEKIARLARRVHALPVPPAARSMSPADWIVHYQDALVRHEADANHRLGLRAGLAARLAELAELPPVAPVLCHSDLHPGNLIEATQGLVLLDWEYAHVSEPFWDLAGWACNNDFGAHSRHLLLQSYLGRQPATHDDGRLQQLMWLYDYVCLLWSELYLKLKEGTAQDGVSTRVQLLAARLKCESGGGAG
jgi:thiamine kinase